MKKDFDWCTCCCYSIINTKTNATILDVPSYHCFSRLPQNNSIYINSSITIKKYSREISLPYVDFYIQYIVDMLKLEDVIIEKDSLTFKAFKERSKNLLVLTLVRFLFEYMGNELYIDKNSQIELSTESELLLVTDYPYIGVQGFNNEGSMVFYKETTLYSNIMFSTEFLNFYKELKELGGNG